MMKHFYPFILLVFTAFVLQSCGGTQHTFGTSAEDKALVSAIKKIDKNPDDTLAAGMLKRLYNDAATLHLNRIERYETLTDDSRWQKMIQEYNALEKMNALIYKSKNATSYIRPVSFKSELDQVRHQAAESFYEKGMKYLSYDDKESAREAYNLLTKAAEMVPDYRDVKRQIVYARDRSILNVVISPIYDESSYYRSLGSNRYGNSFNNDYFQRNLVRDLGGDSYRNGFARYFTDRDARRNRIAADWVVDLTWIDLYIPRPYTRQSSREVSRQIKTSTDTTGKPVYETVRGTLTITQHYFTARGELESRITDAHTGYNVDLNRYTSSVDWKSEYATYRGDPRALGEQDKILLNNQIIREPAKDEILDALFQKIYPQTLNGIRRLTR